MRIAKFTWAALLIGATILPLGCDRKTSSGPNAARPKTIYVFAAASLNEPFTKLSEIFSRLHPACKVQFNFGGSNQLRAQLEQGALADIFASANRREMDALAKSGRVKESGIRIFAHNRLALIIPRNNPGELNSLADLAKPGIKLVIADAAVPVGSYTLQMLKSASLEPTYGADFLQHVLANVKSREENVEAVVTKVRLGEADAGIAYCSDLHGIIGKDLVSLPIPDAINPRANYPMAIISTSSDPKVAQEFVDLVVSSAGQEILAGYGFEPAVIK